MYRDPDLQSLHSACSLATFHKIQSKSETKLHTQKYRTPKCSAKTRESTNTASWCDRIGNSPLDTIHFAKTTILSSKFNLRIKFVAVQQPLLVETNNRSIPMVSRTCHTTGCTNGHRKNNEKQTASKHNVMIPDSRMRLRKCNIMLPSISMLIMY
jgi:hypothetical protein